MRGFCACALVLFACGHSRPPDNGGDGGGVPCSPEGAHQCVGSTFQTCQNGTWQDAVDCTMTCDANLGCVQCAPGENFCMGGNVVACDMNGSPGAVVQQCVGYQVCEGGACVDACSQAATDRSYIACEYWAVDLDNAIEVIETAMGQLAVPSGGSCAVYNIPGLVAETLPICTKTQGPFTYGAGRCDPTATGNNGCPTGFTCNATQATCVLDAQHSPFAIVVSNPQAHDAHVVVTGPGGQTIMQTIAAGQVAPIFPQMGNAIPDQSVEYSLKGKKAYKITSDLPIVAYQFNPLNNANVFSNDASLLIPATTFDVDYYAMDWPTLDRRGGSPSLQDYFGYVTIVASVDNTQLAITPAVAVQASATQQTIAAGATVNVTLNAFDVLQLEAQGPNGDLTGTHIVSTNAMPFGVFAGHEATAFGETTSPNSQYPNGPCCADHLEEMLFPKSTWGKTFAIARTEVRKDNLAPPDYLRIMAQKPGTAVTFTPAPATMVAGNCGALDVGQFCDVKITGDTEITSTEPILVGHYLESSMWSNNAGATIGSGDPSIAIAVPIEQFRTDYTILIPMDYANNYISIAAAATGGVTVDGNNVTLAPFPGGGTHRAARVPLMAGQHTIHCADGCGVLVYGYDSAVSYMFAGGLDLKQIVIQ